jgi:hypothetical protein
MTPVSSDSPCGNCGHVSRDPEDRFCGRCGSPYDGSHSQARIDPHAPTMLGVVPADAWRGHSIAELHQIRAATGISIAPEPSSDAAPLPLVRQSRASTRPVRLAGIDDPVRLPRPWWSTAFKAILVTALLLGAAGAVLWFAFPDELYQVVDEYGLDAYIRLPAR